MKTENYKLKIGLALAIAFLFVPVLASASARLQMPPNYLRSNSGLVGYWTMDGNKVNWATGAVTDNSGQGNTGTIVGMATSSGVAIGKIGQALNFDGVNDYVNIPGTLSIPANTFTISMWVKLNSAGLTDTVFGQSNTTNSFVFRVDDVLSISALITGTVTAKTNNTIVTENVWQHIAYSRSGTGAGTHSIYLNGVSQALVTDSATNYTATANAKQIGQRGDNTNFAGGSIDEARIYNRALTAAEIQYLFKSGAARILPSGVSFVNAGSNSTPAGTHASTLVTTIPATVAGNDLIVVAAIGDDPTAPAAVTSVTATGATFTLVTALTNATSRVEIWRANNIAAGITSVTVNTASATVFNALVSEYSGVGSLGTSGTASGSNNNPTINLLTQDLNNWVVAGFSTEGTAIGSYSAQTGNLRASGLALGDGAPDVAGGLTDNTSGNPASVTNSVTGSTGNWSAAAVELRKATTTASRTAKINTSQNNQITNGLVGLWSFNGPDISGVTAYDRSGQGNNGTLTNGPAPAIGKIGQALSFDGVNDYVGLPDVGVTET